MPVVRIVCAALPGPGHGHPMLAVAAALASRGHDVTLVSGTAHEQEAPAAGVAFARLPSVEGSPLANLRPYDDAAAQALAVRPLFEGIAPDAVVADVITLGAGLAAESLGIPHASLVVHPLHTPTEVLPPFGFGRAPGRGPVGRWRDRWMRRENRNDLERARDDLNRGRARLGLAPSERLDGSLSRHLVLVATLPSLEVPRPDWPTHAHVVGPCLWHIDGEPFSPPPGDGPLVLIAPSTAYDGAGLLDAALDAVLRLGVRAVLTAGRAEAPVRLPANVIAAAGVRHAAVLPHVAAVIANGGHGTVVRALSAGAPLVVCPGHGDQQENAWRVERAGAGIQVRRPNARTVARALRRLLADRRFREAAARVASEAASLDGPARAAELVERLAATTTEGGQAPAPLPNGGLASTRRRGRPARPASR